MAGKQNWQTPPNIFAALNAEFEFAADVAADRENKLCETYLTEDDDALDMEWLNTVAYIGDYVWVNPPYANPLPWAEKAAQQAKKGIGVVMLLKLDTSTKWYGLCRRTAQEIRLITGGRLHFVDPVTGEKGASNNFCSMLVIWHPFAKGRFQYTETTKRDLEEWGDLILAEKDIFKCDT